MKTFGEKEKENTRILYCDIPDENLKGRIQASLDWYIEKATKYKFYFYLFSIITIALPLVVTILNNLCTKESISCCVQNAITVCSVLTTLVASMLTFLKLQEKWLLYRSTAEEIKRELSLYLAQKSENEELRKLMLRVEEHMSGERKEWFILSKDKTDGNN